MRTETLYLVGGTTEANHAITRLEREGYRVIVSVATKLGEELSSGAAIETGRKSASELALRAQSLGAVAFIDCSHPFAVRASEETQHAATIVNIPYLRYRRPATATLAAGVRVVSNWQEAVEAISEIGCRSLLAIGTRNLASFVKAGLDITVRVLPVRESIDECARLGIRPENIIAAHPPYSADFNRACIRRAGAGVLLTKDSGAEGGLAEKLEAATAEGIQAIVVSRPEEAEAIEDMDLLVEQLKAELSGVKRPGE